MTQADLWEKTKSATAVVAITLLIWLAADQNVKESQQFLLTVRLVSDDPQYYVAFEEPPVQRTVTVTVHARRRLLKELGDAINAEPVFDAHPDVTTIGTFGAQSMSTREILGGIARLQSFELDRAESVEPANFRVVIDRYETVSDVRCEPLYGELRVSATVVPNVVSVQLPGFLAARLRRDPVATADAESRIRMAAGPDGSFQTKAPLTMRALRDAPGQVQVRISPTNEVTLTGHIESMTATRRKGPIQVTWSVPDQVQHDYRVVPAPDTNLRLDIDVTGPKDLIDQLDPREIRAFVDVLAADAEKPEDPRRRPVQFVFPPGFSLAEGSPSYDVVFRLEPLVRDAASPNQ